MDFVKSSFGFSEFFFAYLAASWWVFKSIDDPIHFRSIDKYSLAGACQHMALLLISQHTKKSEGRQLQASTPDCSNSP